VNLGEAIAEFRRLTEATTSSAIASRTDTGQPFYGLAGLRQIEKERRAHMKKAKNKKCKGYDPKCRDLEFEVPMSTGGISLIRRSPVGG